MHLPRRSVFNMSVYGMKAHPSMLNGLADTMKSRMKICVPSELRRIRHEDIGRLIEANFKSLFVSMCALSFNAEDFRWQVKHLGEAIKGRRHESGEIDHLIEGFEKIELAGVDITFEYEKVGASRCSVEYTVHTVPKKESTQL